eukprot:COSAG02_NODE_6820_length_3343_cov_1.218557_2_plen_73_part_00
MSSAIHDAITVGSSNVSQNSREPTHSACRRSLSVSMARFSMPTSSYGPVVGYGKLEMSTTTMMAVPSDGQWP